MLKTQRVFEFKNKGAAKGFAVGTPIISTVTGRVVEVDVDGNAVRIEFDSEKLSVAQGKGFGVSPDFDTAQTLAVGMGVNERG